MYSSSFKNFYHFIIQCEDNCDRNYISPKMLSLTPINLPFSCLR